MWTNWWIKTFNIQAYFKSSCESTEREIQIFVFFVKLDSSSLVYVQSVTLISLPSSEFRMKLDRLLLVMQVSCHILGKTSLRLTENSVYWSQSEKGKRNPLSTIIRVTPLLWAKVLVRKETCFKWVWWHVVSDKVKNKMHVVVEITLAICLKEKVSM